MSIHTDGYIPGPWKFYKGHNGDYFVKGALGNPSGCFEVVLIVQDIRQADAVLIENAPSLLGDLEEIKRNCELWRHADNMAGRIYSIAEAAIERAKTPRTIGYYREDQSWVGSISTT